MKGLAEKEGYSVSFERGSLGCQNIVVGDPLSAQVVYTAHYDTCPVLPMPNFITPKNMLIYFLYQIFMVAVLVFIPAAAVTVLADLVLPLLSIGEDTAYIIGKVSSLCVIFAAMMLIMAGPANKHTANDNTSGVMTLISIMKRLPEQQRSKAAFIFFDLEEVGLVGSSSYAAAHKADMKRKLLINFDCVSDGRHFIFALCKGARGHRELLSEVFLGNEKYTVEIPKRSIFYPSDQAAFPMGVGVAAMNRTRRLGILYMDKIHTPKDTVYDPDNIEFLSEAAVRLVEKM